MRDKHIKFILFSVLMLALFLPMGVQAQQVHNTTVYFFWGDGCPHCEEQMPFMRGLEAKYPSLEVIYLETWHNKTNAEIFFNLSKAYNLKASGVPTTFIGDVTPFVGYRDEKTTGAEIESEILNCLNNGCSDPMLRLNNDGQNNKSLSQNIEIPIIGNVDATEISLPLFTILLAGLDSFNPCAFFVLLFLLSLLVYASSRKKMLIIGGVFIFFSGLIYFLFMAAWLNIFLWTGEILWITAAAGVLAVIIAVINIKDFFFFKKGVSLSIPDSAKPKLFQRMRNLIKASSISSMLIGTVVLAIVANSYELLCTAGFPMVFTRILTLNNLPNASYYMYLILYNLIYIIPLAIIVGIFTFTLGSRKLGENEGKKLKLMSGMMMLILGLAMLLKPDLLSNIFVSVLMLIAAVVLSLLVIFIGNKINRKQNEK